ncbi:hypothetical protein [Rhodohalobacter sp. 8-1]|uniref:hypothetical protein n=1 Tax=Rhodohalobacter sp. 8-1 TaxID=3131972 RepID=UPI0030EDE077
MLDDHSQKSNNAFKKLAEENTPSPQLKKKVLSSTNFCRVLAKTLDLFSLKAVDSFIELINVNKPKSDR